MSDKTRNSSGMAGNDRELIFRAQKGNMDAFEQLIERYDKRVFSITAGYVSCADDAKDIFQEVLLRVYKGLPKFQYRSEFSTWIYRITTNVCLSHRSRRRKHRHLSLDQSNNDEEGNSHNFKDILRAPDETESHLQNTEISVKVEQALLSLSPKQRMVFTLKHYEGYKLKEIAEMMNCREGTIKKYLFEAIGRLKKLLIDIHE